MKFEELVRQTKNNLVDYKSNDLLNILLKYNLLQIRGITETRTIEATLDTWHHFETIEFDRYEWSYIDDIKIEETPAYFIKMLSIRIEYIIYNNIVTNIVNIIDSGYDHHNKEYPNYPNIKFFKLYRKINDYRIQIEVMLNNDICLKIETTLIKLYEPDRDLYVTKDWYISEIIEKRGIIMKQNAGEVQYHKVYIGRVETKGDN